MNKKICSILLAFIVTFTALMAFRSTVSADTNDPQEPEPGPVETAESSVPAETTPLYDFSSLPNACFAVAHSPKSIFDSGYTDIPCSITLMFGKIDEDKVAGGLELDFARTGEIFDEAGNRIASFNVNNAEHNLSNNSDLKYYFNDSQNNTFVQFAYAINIDANVFDSLTPGKYYANVYYSSTWKNVIDTHTLANLSPEAGPDGVIKQRILVLEPTVDPVEDPTSGPASYTLSPSEFTIDKGGYIDITCSFDSLVLGKVKDRNGVETNAESIEFVAKSGALSRNGNRAIGYHIANSGHTVHEENLSYPKTCNSADDTFTISIYVEPSEFYSLPAGRYTGELQYTTAWETENNSTVAGKSGYILLTIDIPQTYIVDTGKCGATSTDALTWTLYSNGLLEITGSGAMKDYRSTTDTAPWIKYRDQIINIVFGKGVTHIGNCSAYFCDETVSVTIPNTVKTIGSSAFTECHKLTGVVIPISVTGIGDYAFSSCYSLTSIRIPDSVTSIGKMSFFESGIRTLSIGSGLTVIPEDAFNATKLTSVEIPSKITSIEDGAFMTCYDLGSVTLHEGLISIGNNAFSASAITTINIPDTVTSIGDSAFSNCSKLASIKLPANLTAIAPRTFFQCKALESVTLPAGVTDIGNNAFCYCEKLSQVDIPDGLAIIGSYSFQGCKKLTSLALPDGLSSIGASAFNSSGLTGLVVPDTVTSMGASVFYDCKDLVSVTLPKGLTIIGSNMFRGCGKLESIDIPAGVTKIDVYAFGDCDSLTSVIVPKYVTSIGNYAFESCDNLKSVELPSGITIIASDTFRWCKKLETVNIPKNVTSLGKGAFYGCESLVHIAMPDSLETIEMTAFWGCKNLESIVIPSNVTSIKANAFTGCSSLNDVYCYADPDNLTWDSMNGGGFKPGKATKCHVLDRLSDYEEKFSEIDVTFVLDRIDVGGGVHLYGYTLSLAGDIGVNFWLKLDEGFDAADNYVLFTVNGQTQKVTVSSAEKGTAGAKIFRCGVAAKEMTDEITAQFYLADGTAAGSSYTYTVREYADYILTHDNYSTEAKNLVKAMLNYGACSQKYFDYKTGDLANSVLSAADQNVAILEPSEISYKTNGDSNINVLPAKVSLILKSTISLKLYFNDADVEGMEFTQDQAGNIPLSYTKSGGYTIVEIKEITANWFCSAVGVTFWKDGSNVGYCIYSPAKYCKLILNQPAGTVYTEDLKRVVSALYTFSRATEKYTQSVSMSQFTG